MSGPTVRARLWADAPRERFWLIPDDAALAPGELRIEAIGGKHQLVAPSTLDRFVIPRDEAARLARAELKPALDRVNEKLGPLMRFGRDLARNLGLDVPGITTVFDESKAGMPVEDLFMNPQGAKLAAARIVEGPDATVTPVDPEVEREAEARIAPIKAFLDSKQGTAALEAAAHALEGLSKEQLRREAEADANKERGED